MPGALIALLLVASLLLVHTSMRTRPMPTERPLDVDLGLPLPEIGQASTVFSLTALFGAYFGIYLLLGLPALAGFGGGTAMGLWLLKRWIDRRNGRSFEGFLRETLAGPPVNATAFGILTIALQCAYAASELLILREVAKTALGLRPEHATLLALALGVIGYFYVLLGGYMAVFRTDVLQFIFVAGMGIALVLLEAPQDRFVDGLSRALTPRPGYWTLGAIDFGPLLYLYHFVIAAIMGVGFIVASPDAWKRVHLVVRQTPSRRRFAMFVLAGISPFVLLIPLAVGTPPIPDGRADAGLLFAALLRNDTVFVAAALGLIASFLSAFDSAILAAVHIGLIMRRMESPVKDETPRFHWLAVTALFSTTFLFMGLVQRENAYLLANLLLGGYGVLSGVLIGTWGRAARMPERVLPWIITGSCLGWVVYLIATTQLTGPPNTYQVNTVPAGVGICLGVATICRLSVEWRSRK